MTTDSLCLQMFDQMQDHKSGDRQDCTPELSCKNQRQPEKARPTIQPSCKLKLSAAGRRDFEHILIGNDSLRAAQQPVLRVRPST